MIVKADGFELLILRELRNFFYEDVKELSELDVSGLLVLQNLIEKLEKYMKINDITEKPAFIMSAQAIQAVHILYYNYIYIYILGKQRI